MESINVEMPEEASRDSRENPEGGVDSGLLTRIREFFRTRLCGVLGFFVDGLSRSDLSERGSRLTLTRLRQKSRAGALVVAMLSTSPPTLSTKAYAQGDHEGSTTAASSTSDISGCRESGIGEVYASVYPLESRFRDATALYHIGDYTGAWKILDEIFQIPDTIIETPLYWDALLDSAFRTKKFGCVKDYCEKGDRDEQEMMKASKGKPLDAEEQKALVSFYKECGVILLLRGIDYKRGFEYFFTSIAYTVQPNGGKVSDNAIIEEVSKNPFNLRTMIIAYYRLREFQKAADLLVILLSKYPDEKNSTTINQVVMDFEMRGYAITDRVPTWRSSGHAPAWLKAAVVVAAGWWATHKVLESLSGSKGDGEASGSNAPMPSHAAPTVQSSAEKERDREKRCNTNCAIDLKVCIKNTDTSTGCVVLLGSGGELTCRDECYPNHKICEAQCR